MIEKDRLMGYAIKIDDSSSPLMTPSPEFRRIQSPELVRKTAEWMESFFGRRKTIPDGQIISSPVLSTMVMNSVTMAQVKQALAERNYREF